jgi:hypothetical protein
MESVLQDEVLAWLGLAALSVLAWVSLLVSVSAWAFL